MSIKDWKNKELSSLLNERWGFSMNLNKLNESKKANKLNNLNIDTLNKTFNEVLMRSINTSITSVIPIASILFLGNYLGLAGSLNDFALPLFIGIISGTYSSIFVTVPFLTKIIKS